MLFSPQDKPSAGAIAAGLAALLLPFTVVGPFVGVFLDRWRRRQVLVYANLVRLAPVAVLAAMVAAGEKGGWLFVVVLLALSVNRFLLAGLSAALPHVVVRRELVLANSLTPTSGTIAFIVGVGLASVARSVLPDDVLVLVSGLGYLAAALLALRMPADSSGRTSTPRDRRCGRPCGAWATVSWPGCDICGPGRCRRRPGGDRGEPLRLRAHHGRHRSCSTATTSTASTTPMQPCRDWPRRCSRPAWATSPRPS